MLLLLLPASFFQSFLPIRPIFIRTLLNITFAFYQFYYCKLLVYLSYCYFYHFSPRFPSFSRFADSFLPVPFLLTTITSHYHDFLPRLAIFFKTTAPDYPFRLTSRRRAGCVSAALSSTRVPSIWRDDVHMPL